MTSFLWLRTILDTVVFKYRYSEDKDLSLLNENMNEQMCYGMSAQMNIIEGVLRPI